MEPGVGAVCTALRPQEPRIPGLARVASLLLPLELDPGVERRFVRAGCQSPSDAASDVSSTSHIVSECVREDPDGMPPPVGERLEERIGVRSAREHLAGGFTFAEFPISLTLLTWVVIRAVATDVTAQTTDVTPLAMGSDLCGDVSETSCSPVPSAFCLWVRNGGSHVHQGPLSGESCLCPLDLPTWWDHGLSPDMAFKYFTTRVQPQSPGNSSAGDKKESNLSLLELTKGGGSSAGGANHLLRGSPEGRLAPPFYLPGGTTARTVDLRVVTAVVCLRPHTSPGCEVGSPSTVQWSVRSAVRTPGENGKTLRVSGRQALTRPGFGDEAGVVPYRPIRAVAVKVRARCCPPWGLLVSVPSRKKVADGVEVSPLDLCYRGAACGGSGTGADVEGVLG
ncbi:hypothetical protein E1301_Tti007045 [Triplophysa tibetana]|uniref:Uncharacterized protein n=1 Tax=Triplophysa tibetana TaxID=1572043 RepID=A0A5A9P294_9TELE|nr:hypothetical protein E1301_Tti007045 [Triplophysa tibetana]